jgi:hypothetical protein
MMRQPRQFVRACCGGALFILAIVLGALLVGCVGAVGSNGAANNSTIPGLSLSPATLSFGNVNIGSNNALTATVTNTGTSSLSISKVSISGAGFTVNGLPSGLTLSPGQTATLTVTFAPSSAGAVTGSVTITSSASSNTMVVSLSGTGVTGTSHSVALNWNASTSTVAGYRTYRSTVSGGPYTVLNSAANPLLKYTDSTVQAGTTYYYVVTSVAADTAESAYSSQVTAVVPKP